MEPTTTGGGRPLPDPLSLLLVGEGNLSFTYALVRRLSRSAAFRRATQENGPGSAASVVATTFDDAEELDGKYPEATAFRAYFAAKQRVPVRYLGSVNATAIASSLGERVAAEDGAFHLVVFNNPHIGFEDLYRQRSLLAHFFASAAELVRMYGDSLSHPQEVVVALCDDQAQRWDLLGCAARSGYTCVAAQPLLPAEYPEYTNRRHQSDAAFPFQRMVQYWFVQPSPELRPALSELRAVVSQWERDRISHAGDGKPCGFSCDAWLRVVDTLGVASDTLVKGGAHDEVDVQPSFVENGGCFGASLNYVSCGSVTPLPLLHPRVVADVLPRFVLPPEAAAVPPAPDCFTPYLPAAAWAPLYRAQRAAEVGGCFAAPAEEPAAAAAVTAPPPPHLDAAALGRPLTAKEAKKLERYLSGYGAAMKAKALQQRREAAASATSTALSCTDCTPPRAFETAQDLQQHRASKHTGAVQLPPTLYARVHQQIDLPTAHTPEAELEADLDAMTLDSGAAAAYCAVCGLQYKTADAFEEHLRYLSPLPGDVDTDLTCELCQPPKRFTDRRGLEQHRTSKHASVY